VTGRSPRTVDQQLRKRAARVIPGGMYGHMSTALLPSNYPQFFSRAQGAHVWDADGNRYLDLMCAFGPNLLGYGHEVIDRAFREQLDRGDVAPGPSPLMVDLAEQFVSMVSHAAWAMFCKNGTDATTMALMVARAHTGRRALIRCTGSYHGSAPWCTPILSGTIPEDRAHQFSCNYNDLASLEAALNAAGDDLAAIIVVPYRHDAFRDQTSVELAFARRVRAACNERGAVLILDEVRAGLRLARDASWAALGVQPDLSSWGKSFANGHPLSALLGSERFRDAAARIYVTGSYWYAAAPMAAALETLRVVRESDYLEHLERLGERLREGLAAVASRQGFGFRQTGPVQMPLFMFDDDSDLRQGFCWSSEMLERGVYVHPWHNMFLCAAMTVEDVDFTIQAAEGAFVALKSRLPTLEPHERVKALLSAR
jgi:glutamate-1-semialdehyde 2,1-aminomutase